MTKHHVHEKIREMVTRGHTQQTIARELGMSQSAVSQMMKRMVVRGELEHEFKVRDPKFVQRVLELHATGITVAQISLETGRNMSVIYAIIREMVMAGAIEGRGRGRPKMSQEIREKIIELSNLGVPVAEIAVQVGRSSAHISNVRSELRAAGLIPPKKHRNMGLPFDYTPEIEAKIRRLVELGHTTLTIAYSIGVNEETLKRFLAKHGIMTRRQAALARYKGSRPI